VHDQSSVSKTNRLFQLKWPLGFGSVTILGFPSTKVSRCCVDCKLPCSFQVAKKEWEMCLRLPKLGGNPLTRSTSEDNRKNAEIEKIIRKDRKDQAKKVKILLLGE
jgi:hypothetical protein